MIEIDISNTHLPPAERFEQWAHQLRERSLMPTVVHSDSKADYHVRGRLLQFDTLQVTEITLPVSQAYRSDKLIARGDPEVCHLSFSLDGHHEFTQASNSVTVSRGELLFYDSSHPFQGTMFPDGGCAARTSTVVMAQFPRDRLPFRRAAVDRLLATRLPSGQGLGALVLQCLTELSSGFSRHTPADATRLSTIAMDLITALCAHRLEAETAVAPETRHRVLITRIHAFIDAHLADPHLTPASIAAAHHISTSHLHNIFSGHDTTVAASIRERRLERCRRDLTNPAQDKHPISMIAARWGFTSSAHFSRVFRRTFGMSPRDYRHLRQGSSRTSDATSRVQDA
ncbi:helix-turn-helix domain-containing protein [Actinomadura sp. KC216]|uniref:helix-turn-helix domain-containing protein n=1 Tax=Actinomadura sp. KC216 TaxID=2530370 RepID=UPI001FB69251|nr:helix-turn-helix domain-containing protein [Actinomadura sp. KC216]